MTKTLAIHSDIHCNSTVGLCKPVIERDDGESIHASEFQRELFHGWEDALEKIDKLKQGKLTTVFNGDTVEVDAKKRSTQIMCQNENDIFKATVSLLEPACQMSDYVYFTKGTAAHSGKSAVMEEQVAGNFDNVVADERRNRKTWWHLPLKIEGVKFDIMHHPRTNGGGRPMNSQGAIDRLASDTLFECANFGMDLPQFVIRSHIHHYLDSHDAFRVRAITTPAWSLLTEFGYRIGLSIEPTFGSLLFLIDGDQVELHKLFYTVKERVWQVIV